MGSICVMIWCISLFRCKDIFFYFKENNSPNNVLVNTCPLFYFCAIAARWRGMEQARSDSPLRSQNRPAYLYGSMPPPHRQFEWWLHLCATCNVSVGAG